jgi:hypothetical protein
VGRRVGRETLGGTLTHTSNQSVRLYQSDLVYGVARSQGVVGAGSTTEVLDQGPERRLDG